MGKGGERSFQAVAVRGGQACNCREGGSDPRCLGGSRFGIQRTKTSARSLIQNLSKVGS